MTSVLFTKGQSIQFIEKVFGEGKLSNGGLNISVVCPVCVSKKGFGYSKKKLVIRTDNFVSHCWVCNTKSKNLIPWIKKWHPEYLNEYITNFLKAEQLTDIDADEIKKKNTFVCLPTNYKFLLFEETLEAKRAKNYLFSRGISLEKDFWYWKFGIAPNNKELSGRVIIPSFDANGNLNYWTARSYDRKVWPKYLNSQIPRESVIFNEINIDWSKPLTLVEGPFDLLKCNTNATCLLGSSFSPDYLLFRRIVEHETPVVLALDEDAKQKALEISKLLNEYGVPVRILNVPKEKGDVGAMTKEEFKVLESHGTQFNIENYLLQKIRIAFEKI